MKLIDSRRLTGPNMYGRSPGAVAQVELDSGETIDAIEAAWTAAAGEARARLGWKDGATHVLSLIHI